MHATIGTLASDVAMPDVALHIERLFGGPRQQHSGGKCIMRGGPAHILPVMHTLSPVQKLPGRGVRVAAALYVALWAALGIAPSDRLTWLLENTFVVGLALLLWVVRRAFRFSDVSLYLILAFLTLHAVGAHYMYSEVPYDAWWRALTGHSLNEMLGWQRNHFDRLVHFCYGLLLVYPIREFFLRVVEVRGFWGYFLPLDVTLSTSALYELIEWGAAEIFGGDLGMHYLGTQGDVWDAHKDMGLAALGALIATLVIAAINRRLKHDPAWEWSNRIKAESSNRLNEAQSHPAVGRVPQDR